MNSRQRPTYWQRLRAHPGKGYATMFTLLGALVGAQRHDASLESAIMGALVMGLFCWGIVLWTARTQPVHEDDQ